MRELCIACNKSNAQMLDDLHKYLTITSHQIVTNFADDNFNYILFADTTNFNCVFQLKNAFLNYFVKNRHSRRFFLPSVRQGFGTIRQRNGRAVFAQRYDGIG